MSTYLSLFALSLLSFLGIGPSDAATTTFGKWKLSSTCGNYSTTSATLTDVTNLTVTIKTTGKPVVLAVVHDGANNTLVGGFYGRIRAVGSVNAAQDCAISYIRDGSGISLYSMRLDQVNAGSGGITGSGLHGHIDFGATAGSHTYKMQTAAVTNDTTCQWQYLKFAAYELQ